MITHVVQSGDTLNRIATRYNVTVRDIQNANKKLITNVNIVKVGWALKIPIETATNYYELGKQLEKCLNDIEKLDSFKILRGMMKG